MEVKKNGTQGSQKGPEEYFTGNVRIDPLNQAPEPARVSCALVTFEPGDLAFERARLVFIEETERRNFFESPTHCLPGLVVPVGR